MADPYMMPMGSMLPPGLGSRLLGNRMSPELLDLLARLRAGQGAGPQVMARPRPRAVVDIPAGAQILAAPNTFVDRTKWLDAPDMMRSFMAGSLIGAPNPFVMALTGAGAGMDTGWEQMYGHDPKMDDARMAAVPDPEKVAAQAAARLAQSELIVPARPGRPAQVIPQNPTVDVGSLQVGKGKREQSILQDIMDILNPPKPPPVVAPPNPAAGLINAADLTANRQAGADVLLKSPTAQAAAAGGRGAPPEPPTTPEALQMEAPPPAITPKDAKAIAAAALRPKRIGGWKGVMADAANREGVPIGMKPVTELTPEEVLDTAAGRINQETDEPFLEWTKRMEEQRTDAEGKRLLGEDGKPVAMPWEGLFDSESGAVPAAQVQLPRFIPPKGVSQRLQDAMNDPEVRRQLLEHVEEGSRQVKGSWYHTMPLYKAMVAELGPVEGPKGFKTFLDMVASTSPRSSIQNNIRTASKYYHDLMSGTAPQDLTIPEKGSGYGSIAQKLHRQNAENFSSGKVDPYQNPKPVSFSGNLQGNEENITVDTHNWRAIGMASRDPRFLETQVIEDAVNDKGKKIKVKVRPQDLFHSGKITMDQLMEKPTWWSSTPNDNEYGAAEEFQQVMARGLGITPADFQGRMWIGAGTKTGLESTPETFMTTLAKRIAYTAHRTGRDVKEVFRLFLQGKIPLAKLQMPAGPGSPMPAAWTGTQSRAESA